MGREVIAKVIVRGMATYVVQKYCLVPKLWDNATTQYNLSYRFRLRVVLE